MALLPSLPHPHSYRHLTPSLLLLLCLALSVHTLHSSPSSESAQSQADSAPLQQRLSASLAHILRARRSTELQAPPHYYAASRLAGGYFGSAPSKRDDGYWIWMPAHGYMSVPRDEVAASSGDKDSMGNLLRYGRK